MKNIKDTQVAQKDMNLIRVVPWSDSEVLETELSQLCQDLRAIIGESVQVRWEIVKEIKPSSSGKFRWIISDVSRGFIETGKV
jgi:hypothetical protein